MRHELVEALSGALFSIALIALERFLPFTEPTNILVAGLAGTGLFFALFTLVWRFRHSRLMRSFSDDLHHFAGNWLEEWHDGTNYRYSFANVRFDESLKQYSLTGNSYDETGKWKARWTSHHLFYDHGQCRLVYVSDGNQIGARTVFGATCFFVDRPGIESGRGFFVDDSSGELEHFDFEFKKLNGESELLKSPEAWVVKHHAARMKVQ
jgi:hypothetical protein